METKGFTFKIERSIAKIIDGPNASRHLLYFPAAIVFLFNMIFFNRYFPLTEGWWQTFGNLINQGSVPFKDFNAVIPPAFMYFNSILLHILGDQIIFFRILGVLLRVLNVFLLQKFLQYFFSSKIACLAALFASFLSISDPAYIAYDYHTFVDLLIVLSLIFLGRKLNLRSEGGAGSGNGNLLMSGICLGILFFFKQNIGLFLLIGFFLSLLILRETDPNPKWKRMIYFGTGFFVIWAIFFYFFFVRIGAIKSLEDILSGNDAKGSFFTVITRFVLDDYNRKVLVLSIVIVVVYLFIKNFPTGLFRLILSNSLISRHKIEIDTVSKYLISAFFFISVLGIAGHVDPLYSIFYKTINSVALSVVLYILFKAITGKLKEKDYKFTVILPLLLALAYCNTHTAGFNFVGMLFVIAVSWSLIFEKIMDQLKISYKYIFLAIIFIIASMGVSKLFLPYDWWRLTQGPIMRATHELKYQGLKGFYVDKKTYICYEKIGRIIEEHSRGPKDVYLFPNIPIFYFLHGKTPPYRNVVQWFDFISKEQLLAELKELQQDPPKIIVFLEPPKFVYEGHYKLLKRQLVQLQFRDQINKWQIRGKYEQVDVFMYDDRFLSDTYASEERIERDVMVTNRELKDREYGDLTDVFEFGDLKIKNVTRGGLEVSNERGKEKTEGFGIQMGDRLKVETKKKYLNQLLLMVGYIEEEKEFYVLRILVRNDRENLD